MSTPLELEDEDGYAHTRATEALSPEILELCLRGHRITSLSREVEGGTYKPHEGHLTYAVDSARDSVLMKYLNTMETDISKVKTGFEEMGIDFPLNDLGQSLIRRIRRDFPGTLEEPGDIHHLAIIYLGEFMQEGNMDCARLALLTAAIMQRLKSKRIIPQEIEVRVMGDWAANLSAGRRRGTKGKESGHGYVIAKQPGEKTNDYFVIDPAQFNSKNIRNILLQENSRNPMDYRYLFGVLRMIFQEEPDAKDEEFLDMAFRAITDKNLVHVLADVKRAIKDNPAALRRFTDVEVRNVLDE